MPFRYRVLRVWELAGEPLLTGGMALLPLAPISAVTEDELPGIIRRMERRLSSRRARAQAEVVWAASYILLGLRSSPELPIQLRRGVLSRRESSTDQAIRAEGRSEGQMQGAIAEAKKVLRIQGDDAFGPSNARTAKFIERLDDLTRLEELLRRLRRATSWQELLGTFASRRRQSSE